MAFSPGSAAAQTLQLNHPATFVQHLHVTFRQALNVSVLHLTGNMAHRFSRILREPHDFWDSRATVNLLN